jgi:hypothetical protein
LPLRLWRELEEKGKAKMKKSAFAVAATACIFVAGGARADDADRYKAFNDFLESRPDKCKEATARIVEATNGRFKVGRIDDAVEIAGDPPIVVQIDCGSSDDTISVTITSDVQYPPNSWFAVAAKAGHGPTGDPVGDIAKVARKCFLDGMKKPDGYNEADLPKTHFKCYQADSPSPFLTIEFEAPYAN